MMPIYRGFIQSSLAAAMLAAFLWAVAARADDWPQWRGPNRDGVWSETGILEAFPPGGLKIRWRATVGVGVSTPVVAEGRVYVTDSELMHPKARERMHCFEGATGKPLWSYAYDVNYPAWAIESFETGFLGPVATPIVSGGKVYALGFLGHLFCLDAAKGDVIWRKDLAQEYPAKELNCHASPLIDGDLLIVFVGAKPDACVIAIDKNTGQQVWKALDELATSSSPIVTTAGGARQLIVWTQESVTSLDPATGKTHWSEQSKGLADYSVATPVWSPGRLLISGLMLKMDEGKPAAEVLWPAALAGSRRVLSNTSTPLVRGDHVYSAKSLGELICLETSTGKQVWETDKVTDLRSGASMHLTPNGDAVWIFNDRGELIRARLTPEGYQELGRTPLIEPTYPFSGRKVAWAPPAYANRHVFARSAKELVCASLAAEATPDKP